MRIRIAVTSLTVGAIVVCLGAGTAEAVRPYDCGHAGGEIITVRDPDVPGSAICTCKGGFYDGQTVFGSFPTPEGWITCIM